MAISTDLHAGTTRQHRYLRAFAISALLVWSAGVTGETVYKYTDASGAVTFSDTPPPQGDDFDIIDLPEYPATADHNGSGIEEITETADRLQADRLRREQARQRQNTTTATPPVREEADEPRRYYPGFPYYRHYRQPRPQPPYRLERPVDPDARRREKLTAPLKTPSFRSEEPIREQLR